MAEKASEKIAFLEDKLAATERNLNWVTNATKDIAIIYCNDRKIQYMNDPMQTFLAQYSLNIKVGTGKREMLNAVALAAYPNLDDSERECWVDEKESAFEAFIDNPTGHLIKFANGEIYQRTIRKLDDGSFLELFRNVTQEHIHKEKLSAMLTSSRNGIAFLRKDSTIEYTNPAFVEMFDLQDFKFTDETRFMDTFNYIREHGYLRGRFDDDDEWYDHLQYIAELTVAAETTPQTMRSGDRHFNFSRCYFENGESMVEITDVSENIKHERTLQREKERAQAAERAKSEFLANMSHEIRTPMNGVMGMAELLYLTELDSRQRIFAETIINSGEALLTIINDVLDFSKIDAGQLELHPAPFDLRTAVEDVAALIAPKVPSKDVELAVRIAPNFPATVIGDAGRLRQIVTNLVGNAVKFTEKGHILIDVSSTSIYENDTVMEIAIRVEDTGIGIAKDKCASIFGKFAQVDNSLTREYEGTGLGLSISSSLAKLMNGTIELESDFGKGSAFTLRIQLPVQTSVDDDMSAAINFNDAHVLIIDDNALSRQILTEELSNWGLSSIGVATGTEAISLLTAVSENDDAFDLVILDYQMPDVNGADVLRALHDSSENIEVPVVLLTPVDKMEDETLYTHLGTKAHISKPARSHLLRETIATLLAENSNVDTQTTPRMQHPLDERINKLKSTAKEAATLFEQSIETESSAKHAHIDVLIAEDNIVNQLVYKNTLIPIGCSFKIAENGREAVEFYKTHSPKIILMDVSMPEMNGLDATKEIRIIEHDLDHHTLIIGASAHAMEGDRIRCIDAGMDDYMVKPIQPQKLIEKIRTAIEELDRKSA